jgi:thioredoxin reductase
MVTIIGAGPSGLAVAACLKEEGVEFELLEREHSVASAWRRHYDRLHLHTDRDRSNLPLLKWPRGTPMFPSREQVIAYLEDYAKRFQLAPRFGQEVRRVFADGDAWVVEASGETFRSKQVVVATGFTAVPVQPSWPGQERFGKPLLHSASYQNGAAFKGQRVLVIGLGNSGGEIAIDLHEHGAQPSIAVRSAVNVVPRMLLGLPLLATARLMSLFPPAVADALAAPLVRSSIGDVTRLGLRKLPYGPNTQIQRYGRIPLIDVGTLQLVREGKITLLGDVRAFEPGRVQLEDGEWRPFDAVIVATGYQPRLDRFVEAKQTLDAGGAPAKRELEAAPGLFYLGFYPSPLGMLRQIGLDARQIARRIARG